MPRTRVALFAAATVLISLTSHANATAPQMVTDPKGDELAGGPGWDVVSANLYSTGTTKKVGKRRVYTPTALIATVTMAGPPTTQVGADVSFTVKSSSCPGGSFTWSYLPGTKAGKSNAAVTCSDSGSSTGLSLEYVGDNAVGSGNTVSWRLRLKEMGKDLPLGTVFSQPKVSVDIVDPYFGLLGTNLFSPTTSIDDAHSFGDYELG